MIPSFLLLVYLFMNHAILDFLDQVIFFNMIYSHSSNVQEVLVNMYNAFSRLQVFRFTVLPLFVVILLQITKKRFDILGKLAVTVLLAFVFDLYLSVYSGRAYGHYFMILLADLATATAISTTYLVRTWRGTHNILLRFCYIIGVTLLLVLSVGYLNQYFVAVLNPFSPQNDKGINRVAREIAQLQPVSIYIWGAQSNLLFYLDQPGVTKYSYAAPLYTDGYTTTSIREGFVGQFLANEPQYLLDASTSIGQVPKIKLARLDDQVQEMKPFFYTVISDYHLHSEYKVGSATWTLWEKYPREESNL